MLQRRSITSVKTVKGLVFATFDGSGCSSSISACEKGCQWQAALDLLEGMEASRLHTGARNWIWTGASPSGAIVGFLFISVPDPKPSFRGSGWYMLIPFVVAEIMTDDSSSWQPPHLPRRQRFSRTFSLIAALSVLQQHLRFALRTIFTEKMHQVLMKALDYNSSFDGVTFINDQNVSKCALFFFHLEFRYVQITLVV